jgi:hypothetical protein
VFVYEQFLLFSYSHRLFKGGDDGRGLRVKAGGGGRGDQLIMSNTFRLHNFGQKRNDDIYGHSILIANTFFLYTPMDTVSIRF